MVHRRGWIERAIREKPWSLEKLDDAARGMVQGSCDDPPEVQLQFWINMARQELGDGPAFDREVIRLKKQAEEGLFK